jgi:hypothetical protein
MSEYVKPEEVTSPAEHWKLDRVLHEAGPGEMAVALGTWDGEPRIGLRWNGSADTTEIGNPQSRGLPTWFMLPGDFTEPLLWLLSLPRPASGVLGAIEGFLTHKREGA